MIIRDVTFRWKSATEARWAETNYVLDEDEPGAEKDTGKFKLGDGHTAWNDLDYFQPHDPDIDPGDAEAVMEALIAHINSLTPHPVYDDGPSLALLYENVKAG